MVRFYVFLLIFSLSLTTQAQIKRQKKSTPQVTYNDNVNLPLTEKERNQIIEAYGDYAERLVFQSPERLRVFKNILRNRVIIDYHKNKDLSPIKNLSQVENRDKKGLSNFKPEEFNPLLYEFNFLSYETKVLTYRVDNTQYTITIIPQH